MDAALFDAPVAFVDVETTGGHPAFHRVIEIGLVAARGEELEYQWNTLVNPGVAIPVCIEQFTGITNEMVREAPAFEDIVNELVARLDGRLFVAHNARFDYGFIRGEFRRAGREFSSRVACTVKLSRLLDPEMPRHNLDALIEHHGLACAARHRALPDAAALWQYWRRLRDTRPLATLEAALAQITRRPAAPPQLPPGIIDELPESHGVYRFLGDEGALLYVGKANNIRERVLQHWQSATVDGKSQRLFSETRRVDWTLTAGELGALLLEARTVRTGKPLYNRRLRGGVTLSWLVPDGGAPPVLVPLDWTTLGTADLFGLYRSARDAKRALEGIARGQRLCLKALALESGPRSCFGYQVGRCAGVCVGREPAALHAARLKLALARERLQPWPFNGRIGIREASVNGLEHVHVIDNWHYLETIDARSGESECRAPPPFDYDTYRILQRWFATTPRPRLAQLPGALRLRGAADTADVA
ncbi:MAG: exonuclease domain-containing protein [Steroidobacteraceae bacterium]